MPTKHNMWPCLMSYLAKNTPHDRMGVMKQYTLNRLRTIMDHQRTTIALCQLQLLEYPLESPRTSIQYYVAAQQRPLLTTYSKSSTRKPPIQLMQGKYDAHTAPQLHLNFNKKYVQIISDLLRFSGMSFSILKHSRIKTSSLPIPSRA